MKSIITNEFCIIGCFSGNIIFPVIARYASCWNRRSNLFVYQM